MLAAAALRGEGGEIVAVLRRALRIEEDEKEDEEEEEENEDEEVVGG